jgi:hypothetical protein
MLPSLRLLCGWPQLTLPMGGLPTPQRVVGILYPKVASSHLLAKRVMIMDDDDGWRGGRGLLYTTPLFVVSPANALRRARATPLLSHWLLCPCVPPSKHRPCVAACWASTPPFTHPRALLCPPCFPVYLLAGCVGSAPPWSRIMTRSGRSVTHTGTCLRCVGGV